MAYELRYNAYVVRYLSIIESLILGREGFILEFKKQSQTTKRISKRFTEWSESVTTCGRYTLRSLFSMIINTQLLGGELFLERVITDGRLKYRVHESLLETYSNHNDRTVEGITYNDVNEPVSYRVDIGMGQYRDIPADSITHIYHSKLANEFRGTTALAPVLDLLRKLQTFTDAILNQQIISSSTSTVYEKVEEDAEEFNLYDQDEEGKPIEPRIGEFKKTLNSKEVLVVPRGYRLNHQDFSSFSPNNSNYISDVLKRIAVGLLTPYHALSGDLAGSNYSSLKFNSLLEDSHFQSMQLLYKSVYKKMVVDFINVNNLSDKYYDAESVIKNVIIYPYKMPPLEPLKEAQVDELKLENDLTSKTRILAREGLTYGDILVDKHNEKALRESYTSGN